MSIDGRRGMAFPPQLPTDHDRQQICRLSVWTLIFGCSYNRYLAVAARAMRRSLKEQHRVAAERRGEMDLRFAKWSVRAGK